MADIKEVDENLVVEATKGLQEELKKSAESMCFEILGSNLSDATKIFLIQMLKQPELKQPEPKETKTHMVAREEILEPNGWNTRGSEAVSGIMGLLR